MERQGDIESYDPFFFFYLLGVSISADLISAGALGGLCSVRTVTSVCTTFVRLSSFSYISSNFLSCLLFLWLLDLDLERLLFFLPDIFTFGIEIESYMYFPIVTQKTSWRFGTTKQYESPEPGRVPRWRHKAPSFSFKFRR